MRIIERKEKEPVILQKSCRDCGSVIELNVKQDCALTCDQREGNFYTWNCPVCQARNTFNA